jgi:glycosyltransferase involved in cell wall biosynthesis
MTSPLISIILPIYNRIEYLPQAISSVINQTYDNWELIIADDASDVETKTLLAGYSDSPGIRIDTNHQNMGLFANLNQAIERSNGDYILLLCSDDFLIPNCLQHCLDLKTKNNQAKLVLSAFKTVDSNSQELLHGSNGSICYYDQMLSKPTQVLEPSESLPLLLKYGSINGNLTGMFFTRSLFDMVGGFDETSKQAGDWEWVYRSAKQSPILMSKTSVAFVRSHPKQLSGINFNDCTNSLEVIEMVKKLLDDSLVSQIDAAPRWAKHLLQFHLWYALKFALRGQWEKAFIIVRAINSVMNLPSVLLSMIQWLPERWKIYRYGGVALPPS